MIRYILILIILFTKNIFSQTTLKGTIIDSKTNQAVPFVSLVLENPTTKQIIDYTQSNDKGFFSLEKKLEKGVYHLVTRHLGYEKNIQILVVSYVNTSSLLTIKLKEKSNILEAVYVKSSKPILIKKDTIIYNVKHFAKQKQQTLEEVLGDMEGIRVMANGEIEVKGKQVRKVLINGKEVADVGASILTKSLDAKQVQKIEVRFDEKSKKLKESLLDTQKYIVLDITLKNNVKTNFFGKIRLTNGYQNNYKLGYYTNIFSLKDNQSLHFFSEYDRFGTQTISLKHIKYIGKDAFAKIFEIPADFKSLTEKEMYHSEVFNFDDFTAYNRGIAGVSFLKEITPNWQLFFGSYNSFSENGKNKSSQQVFNDIYINNFTSCSNIKDFSSKNKLEFKYNTKQTKLTLNTNLVFTNNNFEDNTTQSLDLLFYNLNKNGTNLNLYNNLSYEYSITEKLGFEAEISNSYMDKQELISLQHNNINYKTIFKKNNGEVLYSVNQLNVSNNRFNGFKFCIQQLSKFGVLKFGVDYMNSLFEYQAKEKFTVSFSQDKKLYNSVKKDLYFVHLIDFNDIAITNKISYGNLGYLRKNEGFLNYKGSLSYNPNNDFGVSGFYEDRLSSFPLTKLTKTNNLINFNTIEIPALEIKPVKERIISFETHKSFSEIKLNTNFAFISGKTFNQNTFFSSNSFIYSQRNQFFSQYQAYALSFNKKFNSIPIELTLEPEALFNSSENIYNDNLYKTQTSRWFLGLKIKGKTKRKRFNYYLYPKYTKFDFSNDLSEKKYKQQFVSLAFHSDFAIISKKLFIETGIRKVYFFDKNSNNFLNVNLKLSGNFNKFNYFLVASNLMNNKEVIQKEIQPLFMNIQRNNLFLRYFKLGLECKF